jgi:hypothetical protein
MATVRIQLRRGEYQDWYDANPQLAAGEVAIETDTNRIKFGDGNTLWRNLDYAIVNNDGTPLTTEDYGQPDGVPQLDGSGYIKAVNLPPLAKITVHSVANQAARLALTVEPGDIAIQSDNGTSYVLQSSPASTNANWKELTATQAINDAVNAAVTAMLDGAPGALNTLNELAAAIGDDPAFFTTVATNLSNHENDSTNVHGIANTADLATKAYADQSEADAKAYTDAREALITTAYENYADQAEGDAKAYTDARETAITTAYEAYADQAEVDAKAYTDARESAITAAYQSHVNGRETAITTAYQAYADQAEVDAKAYADQKVSDLVDSSPAALNTLNELAAALGDDANFATTVSNSIGTKVSKAGDTMTGPLTLSGDPAGALHATNKSYVDNLIQGYESTATSNLTGHNNTIYNVHGIADTSLLATKAYADNVGTVAATELSNHSADTTSVHGISNTADLATKTYADNSSASAQSAAEATAGTALTAHNDDTLGVHGIANTADLATKTYADNSSASAQSAAEATAAAAIGVHNDDTLNVHGIANTANLVLTNDARLSDTRTPTDNTVSTATIINLAVTTEKINDLSVTSDKLAADSVSTTKIADTSVTVDKLAGDSVTTVKILDLNVTTAKIANDAVTSDKIADSAVTAAQVASSAIETAKINDLAVTTAKINDGAVTSEKIANGTIVNADINASAEIEQSKVANLVSDLGSKAPSSGPTFTGTVTLPGTTSIGNVSSTEIGYLDGVTSPIQTQIDTKLASATAASTYAPIASPTFTGTVVLPSTTSVGNVSSTELGYLDGVTSAIQTQIDAKYSSASASTDLALKANLASPALTGTPTAPTATLGTNTTQIATTAFVKAEVDAVIASAPGALNTLDELAAALGDDANFATTVTNSLAAKAPLASPTFTGTVTVAASGIAFTDGTQTKEGVPSRTTVDSKTADYTLVLTDRDKMIEVNSSSSLTISIPTDASVNFPVGTSIDFLRVGSGAVTIAAATPATTTLNYTPGNKLRAQWSSATLFKRAANTWILMGDLTA